MQIRIRHLYRAAPETVQRATNAFAAPIENMGIDHRGFDIVVAQEFLYGSDIILEIYTAEVRFARKIIFFSEDTFTQIQGFVVHTDGVNWAIRIVPYDN